MLDRSDDVSKTEKIIRGLDVPQLTVAAFDTDIAEFMANSYHPVLGTDKQKPITRELGLPESDMVLAREWITKDLMIIASADFYQCDVLLTTDYRTMAPMAAKVDYFTSVVTPENFYHNDTYIFEYEPKAKYGESIKEKGSREGIQPEG